MLSLLAKIFLSSNWKKASSLVGQTACLSHDLWANNWLNGFSVRYSLFLNNWLEVQLISFIKVFVILVTSEWKQLHLNRKKQESRKKKDGNNAHISNWKLMCVFLHNSFLFSCSGAKTAEKGEGTWTNCDQLDNFRVDSSLGSVKTKSL